MRASGEGSLEDDDDLGSTSQQVQPAANARPRAFRESSCQSHNHIPCQERAFCGWRLLPICRPSQTPNANEVRAYWDLWLVAGLLWRTGFPQTALSNDASLPKRTGELIEKSSMSRDPVPLNCGLVVLKILPQSLRPIHVTGAVVEFRD